MCLIDGDGNIFSPSLLAQGQTGGLNAAQRLVEHIKEYLLDEDSLSSSTYELFIYCFLHKKGLVETLAKAGYADASEQFDEFVTGFNQAGHRFLMVDVGSGKENADSKLRGRSLAVTCPRVSHLTRRIVFLTDHIRSPTTHKVFLGGTSASSFQMA